MVASESEIPLNHTITDKAVCSPLTPFTGVKEMSLTNFVSSRISQLGSTFSKGLREIDFKHISSLDEGPSQKFNI